MNVFGEVQCSARYQKLAVAPKELTNIVRSNRCWPVARNERWRNFPQRFYW